MKMEAEGYKSMTEVGSDHILLMQAMKTKSAFGCDEIVKFIVFSDIAWNLQR